MPERPGTIPKPASLKTVPSQWPILQWPVLKMRVAYFGQDRYDVAVEDAIATCNGDLRGAVGFEPLVCADDAEAIEKAEGLVDGHDLELERRPGGDAAKSQDKIRVAMARAGCRHGIKRSSATGSLEILDHK